MAKKPYDNIVLFDNKKVDKGAEKVDTDSVSETIKKSIETRVFTPTMKAYTPYYNPETKKYEIFTIEIDPISNETKLLRETSRYDNMARVMAECRDKYSYDTVMEQRKLRGR